ncbi:cytochrome P450 [Xylariaceae sp. FL0804]|nr:cytochrome P450 [Xylariaceae sp. FL0804]
MTDPPLSVSAYVAQAVVLSLLTGLAAYVVATELARARARLPGVPGPRGWPVVGSLLAVRRGGAAARYQDWARERYGAVFQVQLGLTTVVVVNSAAAARALFLTDSHALGSRPMSYTYRKVATAGLGVGASPYDESLRRKKKGIAVALNRPAVQTYVPYLDRETATFIRDLWDAGKAGKVAVDPLPLVQRLSLSLSLTINWGVRVPSVSDALFREIVEVETALNRARSSVGNAQDHVPLLRLLGPLPLLLLRRLWSTVSSSTSWSSTHEASSEQLRRRRDRYLAYLDGEVAAADAGRRPCIQASVGGGGELKEDEEEGRPTPPTAVLSGGFETIAYTVQWTMAHLATHPEIQDAAVAAIRAFQQQQQRGHPQTEHHRSDNDDDDDDDDGPGPDPLCDAADDQKCSYVLALAKEALRYFSVAPLGLPRRSIRDVVWEGVRVPAGTTVYLNIWACSRDPAVWADPDVFEPRRWLDERPDAYPFAFGLGYRMCTGSVLVVRELYLILMRLMASFRLQADEDEDETPGVAAIRCDPRRDVHDPRDLLAAPPPYRVRFVPRDPARLEAALAAAAAAGTC